MSESFVNPIFGEREPSDPGAPVEATGHDDVDAVVASMEGLDDLSVSEHVAVFEQAHESLRRTLAGAATDTNRADAGRG